MVWMMRFCACLPGLLLRSILGRIEQNNKKSLEKLSKIQTWEFVCCEVMNLSGSEHVR